jgi:hypothetical protein
MGDNKLHVNCRGDTNKSILISRYDITPVFHNKLLSKQYRRCCCGNLLEDSYYCFHFKNKTIQDKGGELIIGISCANKLIGMIGVDKLPPFNPFTCNDTNNYLFLKNGNNSVNLKLDPLNKENYNAIHLLCMAWDVKSPYGLFYKMLNYIRSYPEIRSKEKYVVRFNNSIEKGGKGKTLKQIISELRAANNGFRNYEFPIMNSIVNQFKIVRNAIG